jgi:hypothetical protein
VELLATDLLGIQMAALYDGIEPMLADMHRSTKSTYQIQSTFYVISQTQEEDLLCQTAALQDGSGWSDECFEMARADSRQQGRAAESREDERIDAGSTCGNYFRAR